MENRHNEEAALPATGKTAGHRRTDAIGKAMPITALLLNFPPPSLTSLRNSDGRFDGRASLRELDGAERPPLLFNVSDDEPSWPSAARNDCELSSIDLPALDQDSQSQTIAKALNDDEPQSSIMSAKRDDDLQAELEYGIAPPSGCFHTSDQPPRKNSNHEENNNNHYRDEQPAASDGLAFAPTCLTCSGEGDEEMAVKYSAITEMCRRLCTEECRLLLRLASLEPPSQLALRSERALNEFAGAEPLPRTSAAHAKLALDDGSTHEQPIVPKTRAPSLSTMLRQKFLDELLPEADVDNQSQKSSESSVECQSEKMVYETVKHVVHPNVEQEHGNSTHQQPSTIPPEEFDLFAKFLEKYEIAEALAKTSAMTSTAQMKQRLAARKLEIDVLESAELSDGELERETTDTAFAAPSVVNSLTSLMALRGANDNEHDFDSITESMWAEGEAATNAAEETVSDIVATAVGSADKLATSSLMLPQGNTIEPPRDLLLYLVRMGSFNSAPKINNIDSQDDGLELPKGLSTNELLQHVKHLRGEEQPPLLSRYFLKPSLTVAAQMMASDITDGLRCLKLNTVSRVCSPPVSSPNHIRLLQWNILSQTLGQNNDGFVRCPEKALTWENRKFLIVQEILQNNPDIICLQEVDHYKFLQNILGSQNYEGIFFPKPDSPCLYIEENNGPDGCAIFYKRDKFDLKSFGTRVLEVWRVQSNQVAIAANLLVNATGEEICVCTTHLKARHGALLSKLRNEQGRDLLRFVKQFAEERPVLLCGDFNAEPIEPVYTTILNCDMLDLSSAYADIRMEGEEANNGNGNGNGELAAAEQQTVDKIQKSIEAEPPYTTWKIREDGEVCHTIDYVFYSKQQFAIKNCLQFPLEDEIGQNRTPSFQYPSDHFSLVCDFELLEQKKKQQDM